MATRRELDPPTLAWIEAHAARPAAATPLPGSTTATVVRLDFADRDPLVLKQFTERAFVDEVPDLAVHEAAALEALEPTLVPAPRLVALDPDGSVTGAPAVLMTHLSGETRDAGDDLDPHQIAENAAMIHATEPTLTWTYRRYSEGSPFRVPAWAADRNTWERAFELVDTAPASTPHGFIHRDFHAGNVLWDQGRLTGVVDWLSACRGPLGVDLAHFRVNAALAGRDDQADAVLGAYEQLVPGAHHPHWDVVDAVDLLPSTAATDVVDRWPTGSHWWDDNPDAREQLERFIASALTQLS